VGAASTIQFAWLKGVSHFPSVGGIASMVILLTWPLTPVNVM
jgi:hypothetical protein